MDHPLPVRLGAEALGTFLFFFLGFSGVAVVVDIGADAITPLGVAAGFGFGLALAITAFGHISGGHFNPAVSAGLAIAGRFSPRDVVPYGRADGAVRAARVASSIRASAERSKTSRVAHRRLGGLRLEISRRDSSSWSPHRGDRRARG